MNQVNRISQHSAEPEFFEAYERGRLKSEPRTDFIEGWQIDYLAFESPEHADQPPILVLGGAFQNFNSYKYCIDALLASAPVILIDLPSMGSNIQTHNDHLDVSAKTLDMPMISQLLSNWVQSVGIDKVSLMGMSLGSVVAANFAAANEDRMHRLVLMGVMERTRKSWRMLIEESLIKLSEQKMSEFGEAVVLYLVNHTRFEQTRMSSMARNMFHQQMAGFTYNEQLRYRINAHRLLSVTEVPKPKCETLVATGQFDSFTLPHENAGFALKCANATYAMVENADHVPQLQRRRETLALFSTFLSGKPIDNIDGVRVLNVQQIRQLDQRSDKRLIVDRDAKLSHVHNQLEPQTVFVSNISFFGVALKARTIEQASHIFAANRDMKLSLHDGEGEFSLELLQFEQKGRLIRAIFKHGTFANAARMSAYINQLKQNPLTKSAKVS